ncbi:DUF3311 domain-containing protein [Alicyclobacillus tolerans]|uniref:DUF3311 domain-containing protein n=2 Tax=Alicyclobacillus tolerans TaxID=90970 RepID=A0ABT9LXQ9_9BACL|nr:MULTISPECIES: DUF3311 domain-containing protein [Alicyclobacillus]MDP9729043.1 hypothetical protein [Alicyclobacillus tengchongensis]QRF24150.1 DUF3311 domain-containing protein [Alicyclobacillus sp. TC]SHK89304.1 Protein of unknown function [Alicyclobacillus montanus]
MNAQQEPKRKRGRVWLWLLLIPFIGTLYPPFYASYHPVWFGVPFFYAYQFLWVIISALITGVVYFLTKD